MHHVWLKFHSSQGEGEIRVAPWRPAPWRSDPSLEHHGAQHAVHALSTAPGRRGGRWSYIRPSTTLGIPYLHLYHHQSTATTRHQQQPLFCLAFLIPQHPPHHHHHRRRHDARPLRKHPPLRPRTPGAAPDLPLFRQDGQEPPPQERHGREPCDLERDRAL
ncbi:hypothetical protein LZ30DRAFT_23760 [Colletotrichum cereale]|nr:hypothetical protein LZ30DRAFT_23760 [Colletotrichum cereale]